MEESAIEEIGEGMLPYERDLFLFLNRHHSEFWDNFMMLYSGKLLWVPLCLVFLGLAFYKVKWQNALLFIACFILLACLCDQISANVIKPLFSRLRPTHHPDFMAQVLTVDNYRGGRFGFVSSHAANGFGAVVFLSLVYRCLIFTSVMSLWGLITCYSRIYLGVHFVTDVIGGILLGAMIVFLVFLLFRYLQKKCFKKSFSECLHGGCCLKVRSRIIMLTVGITVLVNTTISLVEMLTN